MRQSWQNGTKSFVPRRFSYSIFRENWRPRSPRSTSSRTLLATTISWAALHQPCATTATAVSVSSTRVPVASTGWLLRSTAGLKQKKVSLLNPPQKISLEVLGQNSPLSQRLSTKTHSKLQGHSTQHLCFEYKTLCVDWKSTLAVKT